MTLIYLALFNLTAGGIPAVRTHITVGPAQPIQRLAALLFAAIVFEKFIQTETFLKLYRILCHDGFLCDFIQFHYSGPSGSLAEPQG